MKKDTLFKIIAVLLSVTVSLVLACGIFLVCLRLGYISSDNPLRVMKDRVLQSMLATREYKELLRAAADKRDSFSTTWDFNRTIALSKKVYLPTQMFGQPKYRMRPGIGVYNARVWSGYKYQELVLPQTPEVAALLQRNRVAHLSSFQTDGNGFKKTSAPLVPGAPVIFLLGDSFTEGLWMPSEETFASVMANRLNRAGLAANVVNLGVNGYSALESAWMLEEFGPKLHPAVVVQNVFPNDVEENYLKVIKGEGIPEGSYGEMFRELERMANYCRQNSAVLFVSVIPPKEQFGSLRGYAGFQERIRKWAESRKVHFLDPRAEFDRNGGEQLYLPWDPHFARAGHEVYAKFLCDSVTPTLRILPQSQASP